MIGNNFYAVILIICIELNNLCDFKFLNFNFNFYRVLNRNLIINNFT